MLERAEGVKLGARWRAALVAALCAMLAPPLTAPAQPATPEAVVVATTAPEIALGQVVRAGEFLDVPSGASVTLLEQTGAFATLTAPGPYVPGEAAPSRARGFDAGRLVSAVATLVRVDDNDVQMRPFRGGGGGAACAGVAVAGGVDTLPQLLRANCANAARKRLDFLVADATPANLFIAAVTPEAGQLSFGAQANFAATLRCTVERPGEAAADLALSAAALPANRQTAFAAPWPGATAGATLACEATGPDGRRAEARRAL